MRGTMIAPWLQRHLEDTGAWNADGISARVKVRRHTCGRYVAVGLADGAWPTIADATPPPPFGAALAVRGGRRPFSLTAPAAPPVIPEEDVRMVMEQTGKDRATARQALESCGGDLAEAIVKLS